MDIAPLDLTDPAARAGFLDLYRAFMAADRPYAPRLDDEVYLRAISTVGSGRTIEHWIARDGDRVIGYYDMVLSHTENRTGIHTFGYVHPELRRRGIGTALLTHLRHRAAELGRDRLETSARIAVEGGEPVDPGPAAFMARHGLDRVLVEERRRLEVTPESATEVPVPPQSADYRLVSWVGAAPEALVDGLAELETVLHADAPSGDSAADAARFDAARWRAEEEIAVRRGRTRFFTAARHRDTAEVVAYTMVWLPSKPRTHAVQGTTVVARSHRGHRLGLAVKRRNLSHIAGLEPELRHIDTYNADSNAHMIAVNDALGFVLCDAEADFETSLR